MASKHSNYILVKNAIDSARECFGPTDALSPEQLSLLHEEVREHLVWPETYSGYQFKLLHQLDLRIDGLMRK
jgi:hypothetical protein